MEREPLPRFCQHKSRVGNTLILQLDWDQPKTEIHRFKATSIKVGEPPQNDLPHLIDAHTVTSGLDVNVIPRSSAPFLFFMVELHTSQFKDYKRHIILSQNKLKL